jgi:hypothetical protein
MSDKGLPQGSWISAIDAEVALKAAQLIGLHAAKISSDRHRAVATQLRQGQVFASDKLFAPVISADLYNELFELCGSSPIEDREIHQPATWDDIKIGSVVLATDSDPAEGWFEAIVMAPNDHLLELRWSESPREASFIRSRSQVALLPLHVDEAARSRAAGHRA